MSDSPDARPFGKPHPSRAVNAYLLAGIVGGDATRRATVDAAVAQETLRDLAAGNELATSALGPLDRIEALRAQVTQHLANDLATLANASEVPEDTPDDARELWEALHAVRVSAEGLTS